MSSSSYSDEMNAQMEQIDSVIGESLIQLDKLKELTGGDTYKVDRLLETVEDEDNKVKIAEVTKRIQQESEKFDRLTKQFVNVATDIIDGIQDNVNNPIKLLARNLVDALKTTSTLSDFASEIYIYSLACLHCLIHRYEIDLGNYKTLIEQLGQDPTNHPSTNALITEVYEKVDLTGLTGQEVVEKFIKEDMSIISAKISTYGSHFIHCLTKIMYFGREDNKSNCELFNQIIFLESTVPVKAGQMLIQQFCLPTPAEKLDFNFI